MSIAWHIARKDLRRFWLPQVLIVVLILIQFGAGFALNHIEPMDIGLFTALGLYAKAFWALEGVVIYILTGLVMQEDPAVGNHAHWVTRPVSPRTLLGGKALGLLVMAVGWPLVVHVPWWLWAGAGVEDIVKGALELLLVNGLVVAAALPCATITSTLGQFLLYTAVPVVGMATAVTFFFATGGDVSNSPDPSVTQLAQLGSLIAIILATGGVACAATIYFTRRRFWVLLPLGGLTYACLFAFLSADRFEQRVFLPAQSVAHGDARNIHLTANRVEGNWASSATRGLLNLQLRLTASGVPKDAVLISTFSKHVLQGDGGFQIAADGSPDPENTTSASRSILMEAGRFAPEAPSEVEQKQWARRFLRPLIVDKPALANDDERYELIDSRLPAERQVQREKPTYHAALWFTLFSPTQVVEGELRKGVVLRSRSEVSKILEVYTGPGTGTMNVVMISRKPGRSILPIIHFFDEPSPAIQGAYSIVAADRKHMVESWVVPSNSLVISGVEIRRATVNFRLPGRGNADLDAFVRPSAEVFQSGFIEYISFAANDEFSTAVDLGQVEMPPLVTSGWRLNAPKEKVVAVSGAVGRPGSYSISNFTAAGWRVLLGRDACGLTDDADAKAAQIIRSKGGSTETIPFNMQVLMDEAQPAKDSIPALQDGDTVFVPTVPPAL